MPPTEVLEAPATALPVVEEKTSVISGLANMREDLSKIDQAGKTKEATPPVAKPPVVETPNPEVKTEAAKVEAKPGEVVAPVVDEADEFLKGSTPKTQDRFMRLVDERANKKAEALAAERLKTVEQVTPELKGKFEALEARAKSLESELRQYGVERSPEYMDKFVERPKAIRAEISEIAKTYDVPETELLAAIDGGKEKRKDLNSLLDSIGIIDRSVAANLIAEYEKIQKDKGAVMGDPATAQKVLDEKRLAQTKAYVEKIVGERATAGESILKEVVTEYPEIFEGEEGTAFKTQLADDIKKASGFDLERLTPQDRAKLLSRAALADPLKKLTVSQASRISELEAQLAKYDGATPAVGGRSSAGAEPEKPLTFEERLKRDLPLGR